jgi:DNA end-binding protein Ku
VETYGKTDQDVKLRPQEIKLAEQLVESLADDFKPQQYHDTYQERLKALIEAKRHGKTIAKEEAPRRAPVIDMMEALKRSLHQAEAQKGKKPMRAQPAAGERQGKRRLAS